MTYSYYSGASIDDTSPPPVSLTGDRPTGPLHLGHYVGSLQARVALQHTTKQYVLIADCQALTDRMGRFHQVGPQVLEVALDYLAVGIDPSLSTIFVQSQVPELAELTGLLLNLVTVARLERNPTIRAEVVLRGFERDIPAGFLTYPVSQAADICAFKAELVPVGNDQLPMIEQANELANRFNALVGSPILRICKALLSETPRLPGIDGQAKMSKSLDNAIALSATPQEIEKSVKKMFTDPGHIRVTDPGRVDGNVVFSFLDAFDPDRSEVARLKQHYQEGGLGDMVLKRRLNELLQARLAPIRIRREQLANDTSALRAILKEGTLRARETAAVTLSQVRSALGLNYF